MAGVITSAENRGWPGDVAISDLDMAGLPAASIVRVAKIATVEARDAQRLGVLPLADRDTVSSNLRRTLAVVLSGSNQDEH